MKTIQEAIHNYRMKMDENVKPQKIVGTFVFDEEKSVKWNQDEVIKHNLEIDNKMKEYLKRITFLKEEVLKDLLLAITYEYKFNDEVALKIYNSVINENHFSFEELAYALQKQCDLVNEIIKIYN